MGIRINKILGWVVDAKKAKINLDDLISVSIQDILDKNNIKKPHDIFYVELFEVDCSRKIEDFIDFLEDEDGNLTHYIFKMPSQPTWERSDDSIDYYEAQSGLNKIKYLHGEIYPFVEPMVVSKTLKEIDPGSEKMIIQADMKAVPGSLLFNSLSEKGINWNQKTRKQIHSTAPTIIRLLCEQVSTVDYRELRPAIITLWR